LVYKRFFFERERNEKIKKIIAEKLRANQLESESMNAASIFFADDVPIDYLCAITENFCFTRVKSKNFLLGNR